MTPSWPTIELDAVARLHALAAGIPGACVAERTLTVPFDDVWTVMGDLEAGFGSFQPDMRRLGVISRADDRFVAVARSRFGIRARFDGVLRPGWCWMQSRLLIIGMAATPAGTGTRVALTGGLRVPGRAMILPIGARREIRSSLDRLAELTGSSA